MDNQFYYYIEYNNEDTGYRWRPIMDSITLDFDKAYEESRWIRNSPSYADYTKVRVVQRELGKEINYEYTTD